MNEHDIVEVDGFEAVVIGGIPRKLTKLPPDPIRRACFPAFRQAGAVIDEKDWVDIDRRKDFGTEFLLDQKQHGSCVGFSSAGALMRLRVLEGATFARLSGAYTYSWINGGVDQGSQIGDSLGSLILHGTCLEELVGWDSIYRNAARVGDEQAQRFRVLEAYRPANFKEFIAGIQGDFIGVCAVQVGNTFTRLDSDGVCGFDRGPGNHAVCVDGAKKLSRGWTGDMPNSWSAAFGENGRGRLTERHIEEVQQDMYLIRAATTDPQDPNNPPVATA